MVGPTLEIEDCFSRIRLPQKVNVKRDRSPLDRETCAYDTMEELEETEKVDRDAWD